MFAEQEQAFFDTQALARLATVEPTGQADADAVGFRFHGERFVVGGHALARSRKYRNGAAGNDRVGLIVDDLASADPWVARGIKIHARATIERRDGQFGPDGYLVPTPLVTWSWGIVGPTSVDGAFRPRKIVWPGATAPVGDRE